ncbi:MAG: hypothetical protein PHT95_00730 [Candidatus Omnitrophica bacterium]|nr:hypothetical protein [Candidatus Omnitrophota bacterium]MDD4012888.1 hypothetical protein [Candidatus Omnitrophota bacterium]
MERKAALTGSIIVSIMFSFVLWAVPAYGYTANYKQHVETNDGFVVAYDVWIDEENIKMDAAMISGERRVLLVNKDGVLAYMPSSDTYIKMNSSPNWPVGTRNPIEFVRWLKTRDKETLPEETIDGYPCLGYRFMDTESGSIVTVWVWKDKDFPVKIVLAGGLIESVTRFSDIKVDIPVPEGTFSLPDTAREYDPNSLRAMFDDMGSDDKDLSMTDF